MIADQATTFHPILMTTSQLTFANRWDHILARWAVNRSGHRVEPGLYRLGSPAPDAPVFVSANYTLSFDALRSALTGVDAYILVLDTKGVNVWCAAGEGTFGTDELVNRIASTDLGAIVSHRRLILPQLGAPGVVAHEATKRSGFKVEYGPVRAKDIPTYLIDHTATPTMRLVQYSLRDRLPLIPVELVFALIPILLVILLLHSYAAAIAILAGVALFPILLPWLPTPNFSTKGYLLGFLVMLPFIYLTLLEIPETNIWLLVLRVVATLLVFPPITAFLALNFTGSTTFTSRTGVRNEIFTYIPPMAWMFGVGIILQVIILLVRV